MKVCPRCGSMCDDNHIYCDSCGFDFTVIGKTPAENSDGTNPNIAFGADTELSEEKQPPIQNSFQQNNQPPLQNTYQQNSQPPFQNSFQQNNQLPNQSTYQQDNQQPFQNSFQQNNQLPNQSTYQQPIQNTYQQNIQPRPQSTYQINTQDYHNTYRQSYNEPQQNIIPQNSVMAIISLVCGILGIVTFCVKQLGDIRILFPILAIIFGAISRHSIKKSNGRETGLGMSTAGLVLGIATISLIIIAIVFVLFWGISFLNAYRSGSYTSGYNA